MKKILNNNSSEMSKADQLVKISYTLFMRHGIRRVTVEEICQESGISKVTFYKHFKNKIDLVKLILTKIFTEQMNIYRDIMVSKKTFPQKIEEIIILKHNSTEYLSEEFFKDLWKNPTKEIEELINNFHEESLSEIIKDFKAAQKKGEIRKDIKLDFIIYFLNKISDLVKDENLNSLYKTPNELIMELTNFFFYGILPNKTVK